jgi:uncharacterized protein (TIGR02246 family)
MKQLVARMSAIRFVGLAALLLQCLAACQNGAARRADDENQIRDVMVRYGQYLDTKDFVRYSQLFAREGEWSGLLGEFTTLKGPDNIRAAMEKAFADRTYDPQHITNLHLITSIRVELDGDRATGYCKWTVLSRNEKDQPYVRLTGHYDDVFIREDGRWKFASRLARREIP